MAARPKWPPRLMGLWMRQKRAGVCVLCTCECVWMQLVQVFGFLLAPPPLCLDLGRVGSDDVAQQDSVGVFWGTKLWINPELLNPGQTFANFGNYNGSVPRRFPIIVQVYCPQLSPFIVPPMFSFPDVPDSCFCGNHPKISVICLAPNGTQISNKLKSRKTAQSPNILFKLSQR